MPCGCHVHFHRYFVAIDETRAHLEMLGIPSERITVSGIPIDPVFQHPINREEERLRLGLNPEKPVLLLSAGAYGVGPTEFMVERMLNLNSDAQTVVICGRNDELKQRILQLVDSRSSRFKVLGYTDEMHKLMKMADIFIGKPGGMTTSEAIACGLPMCVVSPIPGQEERNSDHLLEEGIAVKCNDLDHATFQTGAVAGRSGQVGSNESQCLAFCQTHCLGNHRRYPARRSSSATIIHQKSTGGDCPGSGAGMSYRYDHRSEFDPFNFHSTVIICSYRTPKMNITS